MNAYIKSATEFVAWKRNTDGHNMYTLRTYIPTPDGRMDGYTEIQRESLKLRGGIRVTNSQCKASCSFVSKPFESISSINFI